MDDFFIFESKEPNKQNVGGKAFSLFKYKNFNVPPFFVISISFFDNLYKNDIEKINELIKNEDYLQIEQLIINKSIDQSYIDLIMKKTNKKKTYAIRSSALDEDDNNYSFAGIMESYLNVDVKNIIYYVKKCYASAFKKRAITYRIKNNIPIYNIKMAVIVQEMITPNYAGVLNTINPITNNPDEFLISIVKGLGEKLVSGKIESKDYYVNSSKIQGDLNFIKKSEIMKIVKMGYQIQKFEKTFLDIEFAIKNGKVYFLQSRTIVPYRDIDISKNRTTYDNSNIIESYQGVTTPLTFTFAKEVYYLVYEKTLEVAKVNKRIITNLKPYLQDMLRFHENKIYYNLNSWYKLTSIFPKRKNSLSYMENMMGVKTKLKDIDYVKMSFFNLVKLGIVLINKLKKMDKLSNIFLESFDKNVIPYLNNDFKTYTNLECLALYKKIEKNILHDFTTPIINDVGAMIYYGKLTSYVKKMNVQTPDGFVSNILSNQGDMESIESQKLFNEIVLEIKKHKEIEDDFINLDAEVLKDKYLNNSKISEIILKYILKFGPRVMNELKLETKTLYEEPTFLFEMIKNVIENGLEVKTQETKNDVVIKIPFLKQYRFNKLVNKTKYYIKNREKLRLRRTYLYSVIRKLYLQIGNNFEKSGILDAKRDIFYLEKKEIENIIENNGIIENLKSTIQKRKEKYYLNEKMPTYDRMVFYGDCMLPVLNSEKKDGILRGIPSGVGKVRGKVKLINNPNDVLLNNDILLAYRTDPGWIMLFPMCLGIIVERGSILSHSAVAAREMGIPGVFGVRNATKIIKDNSIVSLDGIKGEITIEKE